MSLRFQGEHQFSPKHHSCGDMAEQKRRNLLAGNELAFKFKKRNPEEKKLRTQTENKCFRCIVDPFHTNNDNV